MVAFTFAYFICAVLFQSTYQSAVIARLDYVAPKVQDAFDDWTTTFGKSYENFEVKTQKLINFAKNYEKIGRHNNENQQWKMELNEFSDLSFDEFRNLYLMSSQNCSATFGNHRSSGRLLPSSFDWRKMGGGKFVSPVKNQGHCGSCWTFSTTSCLESATAIHNKHHPLYNLSEQQLVDCAQKFNNHGCEGGLPSHAFEYIKYNNGLEQEKDYPYIAKDEPKCTFNSTLARAFVSGVVNITANDEGSIADAVATMNPVSIAFEVIDGFTDYKGGVYSSPKCSSSAAKVNHAVLVVGYGTTANGIKYWIIKNSWGPQWGINGYFLMERGKNMCGIATCASYPRVPQ